MMDKTITQAATDGKGLIVALITHTDDWIRRTSIRRNQ
jgi:hypothetical protein